jgi:hypothetical protein
MPTHVATTPASVVRDVFADIKEVEQVYLSDDGDRGHMALVVVNDKDYAVLRRIFECETIIIDALPGTTINFDVVIRTGRPLGDVLTPRGRLLFQR